MMGVTYMYTHSKGESLVSLPATTPWLAITISAVKATEKVTLCPKLSRERLVVVFSAAVSYVASTLSYSLASNPSLLKYWTKKKSHGH